MCDNRPILTLAQLDDLINFGFTFELDNVIFSTARRVDVEAVVVF